MMYKAGKKIRTDGTPLPLTSGSEFVKTLWGADRQLSAVESLAQEIRNWHHDYDQEECDSLIKSLRKR
jgi:hypothetical protein